MKLISLLTCVMLLTTAQSIHAQTTRGTMSLSTGTHFMVAFPELWADTTEKPLANPMRLFIGSKYQAKVRITSPASSNTNPDLDTTVDIAANVPVKVTIPVGYMNRVSEIVTGNGISIIADHPVTVQSYQEWRSGGELSHHLPIQGWGTSYYTMNLYQDRYGLSTDIKNRPGQILIIASQDQTNVTYVPTVDTEGHPDNGYTQKGIAKSITLQRGETFLIKALVSPTKFRTDTTDLTGTYITSNKPIAVVSGHTKGAISKMPDQFPPTGSNAASAHFLRNNIHDVMIPTEFAGTSFVTLPTLYTPDRVAGQIKDTLGFGNDVGDVLRFIGTANNTKVMRLKSDGSGSDEVFTLQRGEWKDVPAEDKVGYWTSSAPMLMGQYGKAYAKFSLGLIANGKIDETSQGNPNTMAGMPMLQVVPSSDRWINEAVFEAPPNLDNYVNIVFREVDAPSIFFDGRAINASFGANFAIAGTPYRQIRTPIGSGKHIMSSGDPSIRWMAWSYGSSIGFQQGRSYGSPVGIDYTRACSDSVSCTTATVCYVVKGTFNVLGDPCGGMAMFYPTELTNATFTGAANVQLNSREATFTITKVDFKKVSSATIRGVTLSGKYVEQTIEIGIDSSFASSKATQDIGDVEPSLYVHDTLLISNPSTQRTMKARLRFRSNDSAFSVADTSLIVLTPGESRSVVVNATGTRDGVTTTDLVAVTECGTEWALTTYTSRYNKPRFQLTNVNFGTITPNNPVTRTATITNSGQSSFTLIDHEIEVIAGSPEAIRIESESGKVLDSVIPYRITPGKSFTISATFNPSGVEGSFSQRCVFYTADRDTAVVITLNGTSSADTTTSISGEAATTGLSFTVTPQPINETATLTLTTIERGSATIELIDLLGNVISSRTETVTSSPQSFVVGGMNVPSGTYSVRVTASGRQATARILIAR